MAPKTQLVATGQQRGAGIVIAIPPALVENGPVPVINPPVLVDNPLAPIEDQPLPENPLAPVENEPAATENTPVPIENPVSVDGDGPHFPGHLPEVIAVEDVSAIALVEVFGIVQVPETSTLLLSLFGV